MFLLTSRDAISPVTRRGHFSSTSAFLLAGEDPSNFRLGWNNTSQSFHNPRNNHTRTEAYPPNAHETPQENLSFISNPKQLQTQGFSSRTADLESGRRPSHQSRNYGFDRYRQQRKSSLSRDFNFSTSKAALSDHVSMPRRPEIHNARISATENQNAHNRR